MADNVKWLKLMNDMFDDDKIQYIESLPDGDRIIVIWVKILCLASKCNDNGNLMITNEIPYTPELLANKFKKTIVEINYAITIMQSLGMLAQIDNVISVSNWCKYQNVDELAKLKEQTRQRVARHRERKKLSESNGKCNVTSNATVTLKCNENALFSPSLSHSNNGGGKLNNNINTTARACACEEVLTVEKFEQLAECEGWEKYPTGEVYREIRNAAFKLIDDGEMTIEDISHELIKQILDSVYCGQERRQITDLPKYILAIVKRLRKSKAGE